MKRYLLSVLAVSLIFVLVGCGQSKNENFIVSNDSTISNDTTVIETISTVNQNEVLQNAYIEETNLVVDNVNESNNCSKWDNGVCPRMNNNCLNNTDSSCSMGCDCPMKMKEDNSNCPNNIDDDCPMYDNCLTQNSESACNGCTMMNTNCSLNRID